MFLESQCTHRLSAMYRSKGSRVMPSAAWWEELEELLGLAKRRKAKKGTVIREYPLGEGLETEGSKGTFGQGVGLECRESVEAWPVVKEGGKVGACPREPWYFAEVFGFHNEGKWEEGGEVVDGEGGVFLAPLCIWEVDSGGIWSLAY